MFPDLVLVLPRLEHHCRCATGEGCPSRVHPGTTAMPVGLGRTRLALAILLCGRIPARLGGEGYLSPLCLVQSRPDGLGPGEEDMLPQTLRRKSPQKRVEG